MNAEFFFDWVGRRWNGRHDDKQLAVMGLGLGGETAETVEAAQELLELVKASGKVSERIKKVIRGSGSMSTQDLKLELGDVFHYWCAIANRFGLSLEDITEANVDKLRHREDLKRIELQHSGEPILQHGPGFY